MEDSDELDRLGREHIRYGNKLRARAARQRRKTAHGFPFDQLEGSIKWLFRGLETGVGRFVDAVFDRLDKKWPRQKKQRNS